MLSSYVLFISDSLLHLAVSTLADSEQQRVENGARGGFVVVSFYFLEIVNKS